MEATDYTRWPRLYPAPFGQGDVPVPGYDEMVQEPYIHQCQRPAQFQGDAAVGFAWLGDSRRMLGCILKCKHFVAFPTDDLH